jgi:hypothetical protein
VVREAAGPTPHLADPDACAWRQNGEFRALFRPISNKPHGRRFHGRKNLHTGPQRLLVQMTAYPVVATMSGG